MIITPNTRGHYPAGYPRGAGTSAASYDTRELEQATDTASEEQLSVFRAAMEEAVSDAASYFRRNDDAQNWMMSRWPGQTIDGRKWTDNAWPWPGASDTRVRLPERIMGQFLTVQTFAYRNMKVQAKAARPFAAPKASEQNTILINWLLFTHMAEELHLEQRLGANWRNGRGASVLKVDWFQARRLNYITVNVAGLQDFINEPAVQQFMGTDVMGDIPLGENLGIEDMQEMIMDPAYQDHLAQLLKTISHDYLTLGQARAKLDDLRQLRNVEVPIPDVFQSRPRVTARQPMVDVLFPASTSDFQRAPWIADIEYVSATELLDRIETANYDPKFVAEALDRRGPTSSTNVSWLQRSMSERGSAGGQTSDMENNIELRHFYSLVHDRGVPVRFYTVMHMDIELAAKHEPYGYEHGEACFHPQRFECLDRPILTSRGIPEIAYTWDQEIKKQRDGRTDRVDLTLMPPIFTTAYQEMAKLKASYMPGAVIPVQRFGTVEKDKPPMWDPGSVEIEKTLEAMVRWHFPLFGADVDPELKQMFRESVVDDAITEWRPVVKQIRKLCRQLLPEDKVAQVVGTLSRPFQVSREALQGEYEMTMTVDLRDVDREWAAERFKLLPQVLALDTQGQVDRTPIMKTALGWLGYDLAESALPDDKQVVTEKEVQDEKRAVREIIASGADVELPKAANAQLRLQTLQSYVQELTQTNPVIQRRLQENPEIMKIIQTRGKAFGFQLQQLQNAMIGRLGTTETFSAAAPKVEVGVG